MLRRLLIIIAVVFTPILLSRYTAAQESSSSQAMGNNEINYVPPPAWKSVEIGNFYLRRKKYPGALSRFQEAVHTNPFYAPAYLGLGKVYEKIGQPRKALKAYQKYLDTLPSEKQAREAKGAHQAVARLKEELKKLKHTRHGEAHVQTSAHP